MAAKKKKSEPKSPRRPQRRTKRMIINIERVMIVVPGTGLTKVSLYVDGTFTHGMIEPSMDFELRGDCHWRDWAIRNLPEGMVIEVVDVKRGINSCYRIKGGEFRCHRWTRIDKPYRQTCERIARLAVG